MMLPLMLLALNPALNHALASHIPSPSAFLAKGGPMNKKWTPAAHTLMASRKSWAGIPTTTTAGRTMDNDMLMMVRGGGDTDDDTTDDSSDEEESDVYDLSSDDDADTDDDVEEATTDDEEEDTSDLDNEDDETTNEPSTEQLEQLERAQQSEQLSSQSRNFGIATALWASLFFDTLLNNAKRCDLFPNLSSSAAAVVASSSLSATMIPTALLASGFGLAAGVSFLLWRDLEIKADMISSEDGDSSKGDSFLSLYSTNKNDEKFASRTRARLSFHLSLFGLLCLGSHAGYYFSDQAPFLGVSAAVINVHNTLTYVSAMMKEAGGAKNWMMQVMMWPVQLFQSKTEGGEGRLDATSFLFRLSAVVAWMKCIPVGKHIASLGSSLLLSAGTGAVGAAAESSTIVNNARQLSLQLVSLARLTLFAGASHMLYIANQPKSGKTFGRHPFFAVLSGVLGLGSLGVGGIILFDTIVLKNMIQSKVAVEGALIAMFGLFSGYNSVLSFLSFLQQKETSSESS